MISKLFDLTGKKALITGGSRGLGEAMAKGLASAGADIVLSSRKEEELARVCREIEGENSVSARHFVADLSNRNDTKELADTILQEVGRIDILINNAGSNIPEPIDSIQEENWDRILELNLSAPMLLTRSFAPAMKEAGWGRVIHISSILALASKAGRDGYSATKSALHGLMRGSALDLGPHGVTVNCIAPGPFLTELPSSLLSDEEKQLAADRTAIGRWGRPEEMIGPALLLASDAGSNITGSVLLVDGGLLCKTF